MPLGKAWRSLFGGQEPSPEETSPTPEDDVAMMRASLRETIARVNRNAGRLPIASVPQVRRIEDVLNELLDHAAHSRANQLGAMEMVSVEAAVTDYLPTSIDTYLALPADFVASHRDASGQTPDEELYEQLVMLEHGVRELAQAVYSGDATQLSTQGRFLQTKFSRSDLDLA